MEIPISDEIGASLPERQAFEEGFKINHQALDIKDVKGGTSHQPRHDFTTMRLPLATGYQNKEDLTKIENTCHINNINIYLNTLY